jgi:hypothetical protein
LVHESFGKRRRAIGSCCIARRTRPAGVCCSRGFGWIVVYDQQADEFDLGVLESLALTLSTRLSSTALASCNADDDVFWLALYESGMLATRYASSRKAFEDGHESPDPKETAGVLARVFQKPEAGGKVLRLSRKPYATLGRLSFCLKFRLAYVVEIHRHLDLANLLGMPRRGGLGLHVRQ